MWKGCEDHKFFVRDTPLSRSRGNVSYIARTLDPSFREALWTGDNTFASHLYMQWIKLFCLRNCAVWTQVSPGGVSQNVISWPFQKLSANKQPIISPFPCKLDEVDSVTASWQRHNSHIYSVLSDWQKYLAICGRGNCLCFCLVYFINCVQRIRAANSLLRILRCTCLPFICARVIFPHHGPLSLFTFTLNVPNLLTIYL